MEGGETEAYTQELHRLVEENHASSYIRFMGHCEMKERYTGYEVYLTASLGETLGLTLLEAAGSGNALIGLNVKYGNQIFIQEGKNGYLTDIDFTQTADAQYVDGLIQDMAENIVRLFDSSERLAAYQKNSYQIAESYLDSAIEEQWIRFFEKIIAEH